MSEDITRRSFVKNVALGTAGLTIVPRSVLGRGFTAPSDRLNIAGVGVGGMGRSNLTNVALTENIVALCDVDWPFANKALERLDADAAAQQKRLDDGPPAAKPGEPPPQYDRARIMAQRDRLARLREQSSRAAKYEDYREMLERQKDIDALIIATPDHMHAPIALAAMELGKHVYVQKPLTWSVAEARALAKKAKENPKLATQMGNQGHSADDTRKIVEYLAAGAIGDVREVHCWTNRPLGYWPQGVPRPEPFAGDPDTLRWNGAGVDKRVANALSGSYPVPNGVRWDLFLGVAPAVPYHPIYHPFNWRGWVDWGVGAIGDMGAHILDQSVWALDLGFPTTIETVSTPFNKVSYPHATITTYEFPARNGKPPVRLTWYDGNLLPPKPVEMGEEEFKRDGGGLLIGSKGKLLHETYGYRPRLLPQSLHESFGTPKVTLPRVENEAHEMNWVNASKGKVPASSPFEYAAKLTEIMLLGIVALHAGKKIHYDAANMRVTNVPAANDFLQRQPRKETTSLL